MSLGTGDWQNVKTTQSNRRDGHHGHQRSGTGVSGAAGGIGRATVKLFNQYGWRVIGVDRAPFGETFPENGLFVGIEWIGNITDNNIDVSYKKDGLVLPNILISSSGETSIASLRRNSAFGTFCLRYSTLPNKTSSFL